MRTDKTSSAMLQRLQQHEVAAFIYGVRMARTHPDALWFTNRPKPEWLPEMTPRERQAWLSLMPATFQVAFARGFAFEMKAGAADRG